MDLMLVYVHHYKIKIIINLKSVELIYYSTLSFSIYINRLAIAMAGKKIPTIGTKIDGK